MDDQATPRLGNLLGALAQGLHDDATAVLDKASGLSGSGTAALLALGEFLGGANVGRLAAVLGLTHSGAVRLVTLLEAEGLVERRPGLDRRHVEVRLTAKGRRRRRRAVEARIALIEETTRGLDEGDAATLELLVAKLVDARVRARIGSRAEGGSGAWWCRTCDFGACGRPEGRCPAQAATTPTTGRGSPGAPAPRS